MTWRMRFILIAAAVFVLGSTASPLGGEARGRPAPLTRLAMLQPGVKNGCMSSPTPSCSVYQTCFSKYCPCAGNPDEYFETYGHKYCRAFLANANFSDEGRKWRDSTLVCLQEAIVPKLDISTAPKCDCAAMRSHAFASHVACYTKPGASICNLPIGDLNEIRKTIGLGDMLSGDGRQQMAQVALICAGSAPDDGRRATWRALSGLIGT